MPVQVNVILPTLSWLILYICLYAAALELVKVTFSVFIKLLARENSFIAKFGNAVFALYTAGNGKRPVYIFSRSTSHFQKAE